MRGEFGDGNVLTIMKLPYDSDYLIHKDGIFTNYAEDFGRYDHKEVLEIRTPFKNKLRLNVEIEIKVEKIKSGEK